MKEFEHGSGVIGFTQTNGKKVYDKVVKKIGINRVALVTGEEKIIPQKQTFTYVPLNPPQDINFEFAAIDEIQMLIQRVMFTERLLSYRGDKLTMFLGSDTIKTLISYLVPETEFIYRDRLSK